jgi:hypothetical protein
MVGKNLLTAGWEFLRGIFHSGGTFKPAQNYNNPTYRIDGLN